MPRLSGDGLLAGLRDNPATKAVPCIFLSAAAGPESRAQALERGADDYLVSTTLRLIRFTLVLTLESMR